jgi:hypothetical protein
LDKIATVGSILINPESEGGDIIFDNVINGVLVRGDI